ncbi:MAG TPA: CocE/NonD family hydrolase [Actinomycetota bacterium]|jgi:predicted acyl esterase|nr:CocE/NonD family hydrolase [Actinomycetota bacterium]
MNRAKRSLTALVVASLFAIPSTASAADPPEAVGFDVYFSSGDAITKLHAKVLRPRHLAMNVRTPVVMTVSPYFNQNDLVSPTETGEQRFVDDFIGESKLLQRGYTYVMVDLPGFGGSGGCNDWGGDREQSAVTRAVEWAAGQPWSNGRVALLGKSYDAWTGLMGIARQPKGLVAVVAMEPVYSGYKYLYMNGVRFGNSITTPLIFQGLDLQPGDPMRPPDYQLNGAPQFWCYGVNFALQQQDSEEVSFWRGRDLLPATKGKQTPVFLTQGFLENNTRQDAAFDFFNGVTGPKRAWFGQFAHVRGWQREDGRYLAGRPGFMAEVIRFLDRHVRGRSTRSEPPVLVQDNLGRYRAERRWPPPDSRVIRNELNSGSYTDDGQNQGTGAAGGKGLWTFSQPLAYDAWFSGEPVLKASVDSALPRANLVANVYDVEEDGVAVLISRGATLLRGSGGQDASIKLYGQDWLIRKGHRIGVLLSSANAEWWLHVPTGADVAVSSAEIAMSFLTHKRTKFAGGRPTPKLEEHVGTGFPVPEPTIEEGTRRFKLPRPLD